MKLVKSPTFFNFIHPDDLELVKERQKARLAGENPPNNYEIRVTASDGTIKWLQISSLRIVWEGTPAILSFRNRHNRTKNSRRGCTRKRSQIQILVREFRRRAAYCWAMFSSIATTALASCSDIPGMS